jgi:error-prone DNA polymerase
MVQPYIARRHGEEPIVYLHPSLERILGKTYGVVLFQEQVIEIATEIAGFTPGEADQLRRAMTHHRSWEEMEKIGRHFIECAGERGVEAKVAQEIFSYIHAYAGYGFCEAHAAAFADTAYKTAYLKAHYPAEFFAALLSHQPMGYYPPNTLIWEARHRGIGILGPDVNRSGTKFTVEEGAIRVSLSQIRGMGEGTAAAIVREREENGPFQSLQDWKKRDGALFPKSPLIQAFWKKGSVPLFHMILCGAFDSLHSNRRQLLWELDSLFPSPLAPLPGGEGKGKGGRSTPLPLGEGPGVREDSVPDFTPDEKWWRELDILGLAIGKHPLEFVREDLRRRGAITIAEALKPGRKPHLTVAGLVVRPHRPPTKSGRTVVFFTLEDETGILDVTVFESVYQRCGKAIFTQPMVTVTGRLERRNADQGMPSLTAAKVERYGKMGTGTIFREARNSGLPGK